MQEANQNLKILNTILVKIFKNIFQHFCNPIIRRTKTGPPELVLEKMKQSCSEFKSQSEMTNFTQTGGKK